MCQPSASKENHVPKVRMSAAERDRQKPLRVWTLITKEIHNGFETELKKYGPYTYAEAEIHLNALRSRDKSEPGFDLIGADIGIVSTPTVNP